MQLGRKHSYRFMAAAMLGGTALVAALLSPTASAADVESPVPAPSDKIEPELLDELTAEATTDFWIRLSARANTSAARDIDDWAARGQAVVDELTRTAQESQQAVIEVLEAQGVEYQSFWVNNSILVDSGTIGLAEQVADLTAVAEIRAPQSYEKPDPVEADRDTTAAASDGVEWGIANINADDVWEQVKTRGEGIVVANIDSGVQFDHPALVESYRGNNGDGTFTHDYNWFDATGTSEQPFEAATNSHGTHTMGTMAGDGGEGNRIGVAPGVTWIAANGCAVCSEAHLAASAQWMLAPTDLAGLNPDPARRPHIINNSWGSRVPSNDPLIEGILIAWADAGIFGVWANGNSGPACETSGSPGSRTINYSVGNHDSSNTINSRSSRGPGQDGTIKPDISAPGTDVRSTVQGGYDVLSGTSMAAPHVSGAVALLWSADPTLVGDIDATRDLLDTSAIDTPDDQCGGTPENNNVYGEGRLDALALVEGRTGPATGVLAGTVTDAATGAPVAHATVTATGVIERSVVTDADGAYSLILTAGDYDVTVTAFGYEDAASAAAVGEGSTAALDVALSPFDSVVVSGTVRDGSGQGWPMYARVSVEGAPTPVYTDPFTGHYELKLPANTAHTVRVIAQYPGYEDVEQVVETAGESMTHDVEVPVDAESCNAAGYDWGVSGIRSHFDDTTAPEGWSVIDNNDSGAVWRFDDPAGRGNQTGGSGGFAAFNADALPNFVEYDTTLVTPVADLTGVSDPVLTFLTDYRATTNATGEIDVSLDGGETWTNVWRRTNGGLRGLRVTIDLPQAADQAQVQARFHYSTINVGFWQIDDLVLGVEHCDPQDGGLVAGHVVDGNTDAYLNGATIAGGAAEVKTAATPSDPGLDDGFYWTVTDGAGPTEFTATRAAYEPATQLVEVATGSTVRADFTLQAGHLVIEPSTVSTTQELGTQENHQVTLTNDGAAPVDVTLRETGGTSSVLAAQAGAPVHRIETAVSPGWSGSTDATTEATEENSTPYAAPWSYVPNYPIPIKDNGVVRGDDGTVYSIAGVTSGGRTENGVFAYDPEGTNWQPRAALAHERAQPAAAWIDGRIYVVGGWAVNGLPVPELEIYSAEADRWSTGASVPEAYAAAGVGVVDGVMYVVGGCDRNICGTDAVYAYRPGADAWEAVAAYPENVSYASCGGIGAKLYCAGGVTQTVDGEVQVLTSTYVYDPANDAWAPLASMPFGLWGSGYAAANGVLLVSGGATETMVTNEGFAYDPAADRWTPIPNANETVVRGGSACGFYKVGGDSGRGGSPRAEVLPGYGSCGASNDLAWLSADVEEFRLAAGESIDVTLTLDAAAEGVDQPGEYNGRITVENGSPYGAAIDVAMTVEPPRGWGELTGTIVGERCDGSAEPVAGAVVAVDGREASFTLRTDRNGVYSIWLDRRNNPVELVVAADGWRPEFRRSRVQPGRSTVEDFGLSTLFGCRS